MLRTTLINLESLQSCGCQHSLHIGSDCILSDRDDIRGALPLFVRNTPVVRVHQIRSWRTKCKTLRMHKQSVDLQRGGVQIYLFSFKMRIHLSRSVCIEPAFPPYSSGNISCGKNSYKVSELGEWNLILRLFKKKKTGLSL